MLLLDPANYKGSAANCFHGSNTVSMESGETKPISELKPGDSVLTMKEDGSLVFSPVVLDYHHAPQQMATFRIIRTCRGHNLTLTPNHLLFIGNDDDETTKLMKVSSLQSVFASNVKIGDDVLVKSGNEMVRDKVIDIVEESLIGFYSPLTMEGTMVVENILASCYSSIENQKLAHIAFAPFRWFQYGRNLFSEMDQKHPKKVDFGHDWQHWYADGLEAMAESLFPEKMDW